MIERLAAGERFRTRTDWRDSRHSFSFGDHYERSRMGLRSLRVINEDRLPPGGMSPTHPHRDMVILSYVLEGALEHRDSQGNGSIVLPGELQRTTAGTGLQHSERNALEDEPTRFLEIWIVPERLDLVPSYEQRAFPAGGRRGRLALIASPDGRAGSITVHQDVALYSVLLGATKSVRHTLAAGRHAWVQLLRGTIRLNGIALEAGDGAAAHGESVLELRASTSAEALLFDLA